MIRVAHIALQLETGGLERLLVEFARRADRREFDLRFVALGAGGPVAAELESVGWPVMVLGTPPGLRPGLVRELGRRLRSERVDVVHTHNTKPLLYGAPAARLAGVGAVVHTRHGQRRGATPVQHGLFRLASRLADRIVCVSEDAAQRCVEEGVAARLVTTAPNGVDVDRFPVRGPVDGGPAVFVGRLSPEKDVETLLRAAAVVIRRAPSFRLDIAGDGPCRASLERFSGELGLGAAVRFLGEVSDVAGLLQTASVFVLSSASEGMPVTVLEAMSVGLPVVATAVGGVPEIVEDGRTGLLVPCGDHGAFAAALVALANDVERGRRMGAAARRRVEEGFSAGVMVSRYEAMYREILGRSATGAGASGRRAA